MGTRSRNKKNRKPLPPPHFNGGGGWLSGSTMLFVLGIFVTSYGIAAMQYSRWDHTYNSHVHPVFHPWAIIVGLVLISISIFRFRNGKP